MDQIIKNLTLFLAFALCTQGVVYGQVVGTPYIVPAMQKPVYITCTDVDTKGTDFWVTFGRQSVTSSTPDSASFLALNISADVATSLTLTFTEDGTTAVYDIKADSLLRIDLEHVKGLGDKRFTVYQKDTTSGVNNKTLHVTSTQPVSVYAFNTAGATTDASILLPVEAWGTEYYRFSYAPSFSISDSTRRDFEMIVAKETTTITTPAKTFTIAAGEVYRFPSLSDRTGRHIISNKPVAYFSHVSGSLVPAGRMSADILFEQLPPVGQWGMEFLVPNAPEGINDMNNHLRVMASKDGTTVHFTGAITVTTDKNNNPIPGETVISSGGILNAGQWVELIIDGSNTSACYISSDKPVGVAAYMVGHDVVASPPYPNTGDPSIAWIPALNQSVPHVTISPFMFPIGGNYNYTHFDDAVSEHYMIIITPTSTKEQTTVNNIPVISTDWKDNALSGYSYYLWKFDNKADISKIFNVANSNGIIVLCGGSTDFESYYYNAGSGACIFNTDMVGCTAPAQPGDIYGNTITFADSQTETYWVAAQPGVTYTWSVPDDWYIQSGQGTGSITVTVGGGGTISVTPSNICGIGTTSTLDVVVNPMALPCWPCSYISGNSNPVAGTTETYRADGSSWNYYWTVPDGWTITNNYGNSIEVLVGNSSGTITVNDDCGGWSELNVIVGKTR